MVSFNNNKNNIRSIIIILFVLLFASMKSLAMKDSPPNPEDGELWIPSDVFSEIASSNVVGSRTVVAPKLQLSNNGGRLKNSGQPKKSFTKPPSPKPTPTPKPKPQLLDVYKCGVAGGVFYRQYNGGFGIGIPNYYYGNNYRNVTFYVQQVARPIHIYNPMFQPTITPATQVIINRGQENASYNVDPNINSGGTGFFLPHPSSPGGNKHQFKPKVAPVIHLPKDWTY